MNIFGSNYEEVGNLSSNLVLQTAGKVKIRFGQKFIDLINEKGEINAKGLEIKSSNSIDSIKSDGIYIVDGNVVVSKGDLKITLASNSGTTYVSYVDDQTPSGESKYKALKNIGFINEDVPEDPPTNGIIYVEKDKSFYISENGELTKLSFGLPKPITEQVIIEKNDQEEGALVIKGSGKENGIILNSSSIYEDSDSLNYDSEQEQSFKISGEEVLKITNNGININNIQNLSGTSTKGYSIKTDLSGQSTITTDNLIVRNGIPSDLKLIPEIRANKDNVIISVNDYINDKFILNLKYPVDYKVGDVLKTFDSNLNEIYFTIEEINDNLIVTTESNKEVVKRLSQIYCSLYKSEDIENQDLVIGKTGKLYNEQEYGIISKQSLLFGAKFDGNELPFSSDELYESVDVDKLDTDEYDKCFIPFGLIKKNSNDFLYDVKYDSEDKKINFYYKDGTLATFVDATDFIKDGMVSKVEVDTRIIDDQETECLIITFNEDSGQEEIDIPLSKIFDSKLYYTKEEVDDLIDDISGEIPAAQVQSDWNEDNENQPDFIKNKPTKLSEFENDSEFITREDIPDVPTQTQANWNETDTSSAAYIQNKPDIYTKTEVDNKLNDLMPLGSIIMWAYRTIPNGWHICDGTILNRDEYEDFVDTLGPTLPDLRGRFIVGIDDEFKFRDIGGEKTHTLTLDEIPSHDHNWFGDDDLASYVSNWGGSVVKNSGDYDAESWGGFQSKVYSTSKTGGQSSGTTKPHNNLPPYYALYYIIKIKKI